MNGAAAAMVCLRGAAVARDASAALLPAWRPDALELPLTIPAELGPAAAVHLELRDRVGAVELERAAERGRTVYPGATEE
jgi:hypothetical protein